MTTHRAIVDGSQFLATGLPPGHYTVQARIAAEVDGQAVEVRPGQTAQIALRRRGLGRIEGRITEYGSSAPVQGMRCDSNLSIDGEMHSSPPDPALQAITDETGHFSLLAPSGRIRVHCFPLSMASLSITGTDVDVAPNGTVRVELTTARVSGRPRSDPGFITFRTRLPITISGIQPGGPAAAAGLAIGDRILAIDGRSVEGMLPTTAMVVLGAHRPGTPVMLEIERGGSIQTVTLIASAI